MMKFRLYDMYDYYGVVLNKNNRIGEYDTIVDAEKAAAEYDLGCDGECLIYICEYNKDAKKYLAIDAEPFDYYVPEEDE